MVYLTDIQINQIIKKARVLFTNGSPDFPDIFKGKCWEVSSIVYHVLKEEYDIPDDENKIINGAIKINGFTKAHSYNRVGNRIIDATIDQFYDLVGEFLSPYQNHSQTYECGSEDPPMQIPIVQDALKIIKANNYK